MEMMIVNLYIGVGLFLAFLLALGYTFSGDDSGFAPYIGIILLAVVWPFAIYIFVVSWVFLGSRIQ